jgi:hypothetical protein
VPANSNAGHRSYPAGTDVEEQNNRFKGSKYEDSMNYVSFLVFTGTYDM